MKKALIIIGAIIALLLIIPAFMPSSVQVERSIEIEAPVELVFDQVVDLKKNFNWSPWAEKDTAMEVTWGETTSGIGASYSWTGNDEVGSGTMTIAEVQENAFIRNDLDFGDMGKGTGTWKFESVTAEGEENGTPVTKVTWGMDSELEWPIGRYLGPMMDGWVGPDFEKGLANLKEVAESIPVEPEIPIELIDVMEVSMLSVKDSISMDQIGPKMGEMYGEVIGVMQSNEMEMRSHPVCVYHVWNQEGGYTVVEAGIPILKDAKVKVSGNVMRSGIPPCKAAMAVHTGAYDNLDKTHWAIDEWIKESNMQVTGAPWEVYITDPETEPDTSKWVTEVYYPVQ